MKKVIGWILVCVGILILFSLAIPFIGIWNVLLLLFIFITIPLGIYLIETK